MDAAHIILIFFCVFTSLLAFIGLILLRDALKWNNEHFRSVLAQIVAFQEARNAQPAQRRKRAAAGRDVPVAEMRHGPAYVEPSVQVSEPAADGTLAYMHPRPQAATGRSIPLRAHPPAELRQPAPILPIDQPISSAAFTGVVIVIGVTVPDPRLTQSLDEFVDTFSRDGSIGCALGEDEFLIAHPLTDRRSRRLSLFELTENFWDLQFRMLGVSPALLAWGVVEANGQPLPEAIESARERMSELRRYRHILAKQGHIRRPAVVYTSLLGRLLTLGAPNLGANQGRVNHHPDITVILSDSGQHES